MWVQCISILGYIYQGAAFHAKQISKAVIRKAVIRTSSGRTVRITAITMHLGSSPPGNKKFLFFSVVPVAPGVYIPRSCKHLATKSKVTWPLLWSACVSWLPVSAGSIPTSCFLSCLLAFLYFFLSFLYFWGIYTTQTAGAWQKSM